MRIMDIKKKSKLYFNEKFQMKENISLSNNAFSIYIKKINFENERVLAKTKIGNLNLSPDNLSNKKEISTKSKSLKFKVSLPTLETIPSSFNSMLFKRLLSISFVSMVKPIVV